MDDHRPGHPKAPHIFPSVKKRHTSAVKCVAISAPKKMASIINAILLSVCPSILRFLQRRMSEASSPDASPSRAVPGRARRRHGPSVCQASKNTRFVNAKHTILQKRSFRLCEMTTFRTPSPHSPWMTPARMAKRRHKFFQATKNITPLRRNAL